MSIRVLVTGSNGQLALTIKELFLNNEFDIAFTFTTKAELDISNKKSINSFFKSQSFDYCINCAAYTNVEQAEKTPETAFRTNSEGVKYLAQNCKNTSTILIHISTDYVFDGKKRSAYTTKDKTKPINEYGKSKLLGEKHIQETTERYFIVRTSWLYSKKYGNNFYRKIVEKARTEQTLNITDAEKGCPTNCENLAMFITSIISKKSEKYGIYHFRDDLEITWYEFAKRILKENNLLNKVKLIKDNNYTTFAQRPVYSVLKKEVDV